MVLISEPLPFQEPIIRRRDWKNFPDPKERDPREGLVSDPWIDSLTTQNDEITNSPTRIASEIAESQNASISSTPLNIGSVPAGLYRVTYYAEITAAAVTSSSLTVSFGWTSAGVSKTASGAAMTGNTTTTTQSGSLLLHVDDGTPVTYSTTYASNGAGQMIYALYITVERVRA